MDPQIIASEMRGARRLFAALMMACLGATLGAAPNPAEGQWPQWRGPLHNGVAPGAAPPVSWSETSNVRWKVRLPGSGTSTPIIWGNQILLQAAIPAGTNAATAAPKPEAPAAEAPADGAPRRRGGGGPGGGMRSEAPTGAYQFALISLDRETGQTRWRKALREEIPHEGHHRDHGFASHSPVTDGQHIWACFGSRGLHGLDLKGNLVWSKGRLWGQLWGQSIVSCFSSTPDRSSQ
jgi:hypothetical protein